MQGVCILSSCPPPDQIGRSKFRHVTNGYCQTHFRFPFPVVYLHHTLHPLLIEKREAILVVRQKLLLLHAIIGGGLEGFFSFRKSIRCLHLVFVAFACILLWWRSICFMGRIPTVVFLLSFSPQLDVDPWRSPQSGRIAPGTLPQPGECTAVATVPGRHLRSACPASHTAHPSKAVPKQPQIASLEPSDVAILAVGHRSLDEECDDIVIGVPVAHCGGRFHGASSRERVATKRAFAAFAHAALPLPGSVIVRPFTTSSGGNQGTAFNDVVNAVVGDAPQGVVPSRR